MLRMKMIMDNDDDTIVITIMLLIRLNEYQKNPIKTHNYFNILYNFAS